LNLIHRLTLATARGNKRNSTKGIVGTAGKNV
jgi:antitoxin component YwqK of YwqJK toxin-antitoxin module